MQTDEGRYWYDPDNKELVIEYEEEHKRFYFQDKFNLKGETYCILSPAEAEKEEVEEEETALIMKIIDKGDEEVLTIIDDDKEFEDVCKHYYAEEETE